MKTLAKLPVLLSLCLVVALAGLAWATDTQKRLFDRDQLQVSTGTAAITTTSADFTTWTTLLTITPESNHGMIDCKVVFDLAKSSTGFAAGYTSETISMSVARKVDGTNYRTASNKATTAVTGTASTALGLELDIGMVGPDECVKVMVKLSAENANNVALPYVLYYRAGARATITPAS